MVEQRRASWACGRGDAAGLGGWTSVTRISLTTRRQEWASAGLFAFFGLYGCAAALATTLTLANLVNCIGFQRGTHKDAHIGCQTVAAAPDRGNQFGMCSVVFDLAAQAADLVVDGTVLDLGGPPQRQIEPLLAAQHEARAFQKHGAKFGGDQGNLYAVVGCQSPAVHVHRPAPERNAMSSKAAAGHLCPFGPAQDRFDPGQQSRELKGLGRQSSAPTSCPTMRSVSSRGAVSIRMGMVPFARSLRQTDRPSSPGIITR